MMYRLELSDQEIRFLRSQLVRHLSELEDELIHTDKHDLQHALMQDADKLRAIERKVEVLLETSDAIA